MRHPGAATRAPATPPAVDDAGAGLLALILAATNDGVMDWDLGTGVIGYSERWKALLGYEGHELIDSPSLWRELSHPDEVSEVDALLREHTESVWPFTHTWRMRHKNGDYRWSLCRAVTIQDNQGVPLRCVCVFTDVTDQVLAQERLAELKRRNDLLLTSAGEGFLGIDAAGTITFANPAAVQLLGRPNDDLTARRFSEVVAHGCPSVRACTPETCPILKPLLGGAANRISNGSFARADGSVFSVDCVSTPARDGDRIVGVVLTFRDVTAQRRLESQHLQGQKLEALGQLAAGIAHEINTPMQYIGDNVSFLGPSFDDLLTLIAEYRSIVAEGQGDATEARARAAAAESVADVGYLKEAIPKAIASTHEGIARVTKIVRAMKEFSHPGGAERAPADLNHAIDSTLSISASTWKHIARVEMKFDLALPKVSCHLGEINQVVLNLIVNAAHAIADVRGANSDGPLGSIRVETGVKDGFAEIRISDSGGGIPEHVRHRLFEPFFTTKEVGRGTGQGLALARAIVDRHQGFVTFTTELGTGTTFTVGLPLDPPESPT